MTKEWLQLMNKMVEKIKANDDEGAKSIVKKMGGYAVAGVSLLATLGQLYRSLSTNPVAKTIMANQMGGFGNKTHFDRKINKAIQTVDLIQRVFNIADDGQVTLDELKDLIGNGTHTILEWQTDTNFVRQHTNDTTADFIANADSNIQELSELGNDILNQGLTSKTTTKMYIAFQNNDIVKMFTGTGVGTGIGTGVGISLGMKLPKAFGDILLMMLNGMTRIVRRNVAGGGNDDDDDKKNDDDDDNNDPDPGGGGGGRNDDDDDNNDHGGGGGGHRRKARPKRKPTQHKQHEQDREEEKADDISNEQLNEDDTKQPEGVNSDVIDAHFDDVQNEVDKLNEIVNDDSGIIAAQKRMEEGKKVIAEMRKKKQEKYDELKKKIRNVNDKEKRNEMKKKLRKMRQRIQDIDNRHVPDNSNYRVIADMGEDIVSEHESDDDVVAEMKNDNDNTREPENNNNNNDNNINNNADDMDARIMDIVNEEEKDLRERQNMKIPSVDQEKADAQDDARFVERLKEQERDDMMHRMMNDFGFDSGKFNEKILQQITEFHLKKSDFDIEEIQDYDIVIDPDFRANVPNEVVPESTIGHSSSAVANILQTALITEELLNVGAVTGIIDLQPPPQQEQQEQPPRASTREEPTVYQQPPPTNHPPSQPPPEPQGPQPQSQPSERAKTPEKQQQRLYDAVVGRVEIDPLVIREPYLSPRRKSRRSSYNQMNDEVNEYLDNHDKEQEAKELRLKEQIRVETMTLIREFHHKLIQNRVRLKQQLIRSNLNSLPRSIITEINEFIQLMRHKHGATSWLNRNDDNERDLYDNIGKYIGRMQRHFRKYDKLKPLANLEPELLRDSGFESLRTKYDTDTMKQKHSDAILSFVNQLSLITEKLPNYVKTYKSRYSDDVKEITKQVNQLKTNKLQKSRQKSKKKLKKKSKKKYGKSKEQVEQMMNEYQRHIDTTVMADVPQSKPDSGLVITNFGGNKYGFTSK